MSGDDETPRADDPELGAVQSVHPWRGGTGLVLVCLAVGVPWILLLFRVEVKDGGDLAIAIGMSCVVFAICALMAWIHVRSRHDVITVYDRGLAQVRRGVRTTTLWRDIQSLHSHVEQRGLSTMHSHVVSSPSGRVTFTQAFGDIDELVFGILNGVSDAWAEAAIPKMRAGESFALGALTLSAKGIVHKGERISWEDVGRVERDGNAARIHDKRGQSFARVDLGAAHARALELIATRDPSRVEAYR
jgi:hypothetical protein